MKAEEKDGEIIIHLKLHEPRPSASGKSLIIASTHGTKPCEGIKRKGNRVRVTATVFYYKDRD